MFCMAWYFSCKLSFQPIGNKIFKQRCGKIAKYKLCLLNGEGKDQSETDVDAQTSVCLLICQKWSTQLNHFSACCLLCCTFWNFWASEGSNISFYKYDWPHGFVSFNSPLSKHLLLFLDLLNGLPRHKCLHFKTFHRKSFFITSVQRWYKNLLLIWYSPVSTAIAENTIDMRT